MKKIVSLLLVAVMLLSTLACFAACGDEESAASKKVKVINIPLTVEEYAFAVSKGNTELLGQLNAFMATIKADGRFEEIINKYFGDGTPTPVVSAATQKNDGTQLVVATNAAFEPFEYKVGENYYGVDMEIMALFAQSIGKELYISNMEFNAVCLAVSATGGSYVDEETGNEVPVAGGLCDVAAAGLTVNEKRAEILDFTESYYNASQVLIVPETDTTFDACTTAAEVEAILKSYDTSVKIGVQSGTTGYLYCKGDVDWGFDGYAFTTVGYNTGALAVQDIINGNLKFVVIDEGPAKAISAKMNAVN